MFVRPESGERAILVQIDFTHHSFEEDLEEFRALACSAGAQVVSVVKGSRQTPDAKYFVGSGKALEIKNQIDLHSADLVIFNHTLIPAQERNLEKLLSCRVLDRTGLILDIFAGRARTFEGKLQVELAQLKHLSTRLVRGWTHLERQKGGIGLRGPGETQLESDRRLVRDRIKSIKKRLEKVRKQRSQARQRRQRQDVLTIALVGYTNAGKSTLFNKLTSAEIYVANKLFATLDPTLRRLVLPNLGTVVIADTVGFVRDLPHDLIEAFRATLEEVRDASLLVHVIDAHDAQRHEHIREVNEVLKQIDADNVQQLLVFNKIDLLSEREAEIDYDRDGKPNRIWVSATAGDGLVLLQKAITERLSAQETHCCLRLKPTEGQLRSELYDIDAVINEQHGDNGDFLLEVKLNREISSLFL